MLLNILLALLWKQFLLHRLPGRSSGIPYGQQALWKSLLWYNFSLHYPSAHLLFYTFFSFPAPPTVLPSFYKASTWDMGPVFAAEVQMPPGTSTLLIGPPGPGPSFPSKPASCQARTPGRQAKYLVPCHPQGRHEWSFWFWPGRCRHLRNESAIKDL